MFRHRLLLVAGLALTACGGGGTSTPTPLATAPGPSSSVVVATTPGATAAGVTTSSPGTSTVPSTAATGVTLSPDGPWRLVDSAPGITTPGLVYELMPKLWVYLPTQEDIPHGITWTLTEADRPVIEAYLQARLAYFQAATSRPMNLDALAQSVFFAPGSNPYLTILRDHALTGDFVDLDMGVVLRPYVLGEGRTQSDAIVFDCVLDGSVFRTADGSIAEGSTSGIATHGVGFHLEDIGRGLQVTAIGEQPDACI